jgi:hypothetical protein
MKRILVIAIGVLVLLATAMIYNVWRGNQEPVTRTPGPLEMGRTKLHQQLEEAQKAEAQAEQQSWDSAAALRRLIAGHQQRMEKLKGNTQAGEILAYDQQSVDRLEKRITDLAEQEAAKAAAAEEEASQVQPLLDSPTKPAVLPKADSSAKSKPKPPQDSQP